MQESQHLKRPRSCDNACSESNECPVCLEALTQNDIDARPFSPYTCGRHTVCITCDDRMFARGDDRCPICRAERTVQSRSSKSVELQLLNMQNHPRSDDGTHLQTIVFPVSAQQFINFDQFAASFEEGAQLQLTVRQAGPAVQDLRDAVHALQEPAPLSAFQRVVDRIRGRRPIAYPMSEL